MSAGSASRTILVEVDDPQVYPHHGLRGPGCALELDDFRLGAIATRFEVVEDEESFLAVRARRDDDALPAAPGRLVSRSILALTEEAASPREANAEAEFLALCLDVDRRINSVTGLSWFRLRADCGVPIALALPGDCEPAPQPGSLILGRAILVGSSGFWDRGELFVERLT